MNGSVREGGAVRGSSTRFGRWSRARLGRRVGEVVRGGASRLAARQTRWAVGRRGRRLTGSPIHAPPRPIAGLCSTRRAFDRWGWGGARVAATSSRLPSRGPGSRFAIRAALALASRFAARVWALALRFAAGAHSRFAIRRAALALASRFAARGLGSRFAIRCARSGLTPVLPSSCSVQGPRLCPRPGKNRDGTRLPLLNFL